MHTLFTFTLTRQQYVNDPASTGDNYTGSAGLHRSVGELMHIHWHTGGGPVSCVQLSEGGFQVVYPLGLWSRSSGVVKVLYGYG